MGADPRNPFLSNIVSGDFTSETPNGVNQVTDAHTVTPVEANWMKVRHLRSHSGTTRRDPPKSGK